MSTHPSPGSVTVVVVDNHDSVRDGVLAAVRASESLIAVGGFAEVAPVLDLDPAPRIVVLDLYLGRDDRSSLPQVPLLVARGSSVVLHTAEERPVPLRAGIALGVAGIALKNDGSDALVNVVSRVAAGEFVCSSALAGALIEDQDAAARLTDREVQVLEGLDEGLTQRQVAKRLGIAEETVKAHLRSVRTKYIELHRGITNTTSLVREAGRDGWLR